MAHVRFFLVVYNNLTLDFIFELYEKSSTKIVITHTLKKLKTVFTDPSKTLTGLPIFDVKLVAWTTAGNMVIKEIVSTEHNYINFV